MAKNYLNKAERDNFLGTIALGIYLRKQIDNWSNNLTKDETKWLKTSLTYLEKVQASFVSRLPKHEIIKIEKASKGSDVRILTAEGCKALEKRAYDEYKENLHITVDEMELIATLALQERCYYCQMKCDECDIYDMLQRFAIPGVNAEDNCPYCYTETSKFDVEYEDEADIYNDCLERQKVKKELKEQIKEKKEKEANQKIIKLEKHKTDHKDKPKKKSKSKRHNKKFRNRYDEEDDIQYTYKTKNFK